MMTKTHYFCSLNPSPWPLFSSVVSMNLILSLLLLFKSGATFNFLSCILILSLSSFLWWLSYGYEFKLGSESLNMDSILKSSMILFILSEVLFFFSFFWGYFHFLLSPSGEIGMEWPNQALIAFNPLNVPLINTMVLLSSGVTVTLSHYFLNCKNMLKSFMFLLVTFLLGAIFTFLQYQEYLSSFFCISDANFGSSFFMLTGFHGIHVLIGSTFLFYCLFRLFSLNYSNSIVSSFELSSWYWHFVDVVWLFLYYSVYYILW